MPISDYLRNLRKKVGNEPLIMPSVTVIHFDDQRRILLIKHAESQVWVAPGGSIEPYETPANAAVREMWGETGLLVKPTRILGVYGGPEFLVTHSNGDKITYIMTIFDCQIVGGEMRPNDVEALEMSYFSKHEMATLDLAPWARVVLPDLFDDSSQGHFKIPTWIPPVNKV